MNRLLCRIANLYTRDLEQYNDGPGEVIPFMPLISYIERFIAVNQDVRIAPIQVSSLKMHDDLFAEYASEHKISMEKLYKKRLIWGYISYDVLRMAFITGANKNDTYTSDLSFLLNKLNVQKIYYFEGANLVNLVNNTV